MTRSFKELPSREQMIAAGLSYDHLSGILLKNGKTVVVTSNRKSIRLLGRRYSIARIIWVLIHDKPPTYMVDHHDGNWQNMSSKNLRDATDSQNQMNRGSKHKDGYPGVGEEKPGRWRAVIYSSKTRKHLGMFNSFEEAVAARKMAEVAYHGAYAFSNRPNRSS